jgi:hypothetical protein
VACLLEGQKNIEEARAISNSSACIVFTDSNESLIEQVERRTTERTNG